VTVAWADGTTDTALFIEDDGVTPVGHQFSITDSHSWDANLSSFSATLTVSDAGQQLVGDVSWQAH
jgi:hypothetical protein